jgi:hypothetical protein
MLKYDFGTLVSLRNVVESNVDKPEVVMHDLAHCS